MIDKADNLNNKNNKVQTGTSSFFTKIFKKNTQSNFFSPNFNNSLELPRVVEKKIKLGRDIISREEKKIIKPLKTAYKDVSSFLTSHHRDFDKALRAGEKDLKIWRTYIFSDFLRDYKERQQDSAKIKLYRSLFSFFIVLLLLIVPFKLLAYLQFFNFNSLEDRVLTRSKSAISNLMQAGSAFSRFDIGAADGSFSSASMDFIQASEDLSHVSDVLLELASLSSDPKWKLASESKNFLSAGFLVSRLGGELSKSLSGLEAKADNNWINILDNFLQNGESALADAKSLKEVLNKIDAKNLPPEYQARFVDLVKQIDGLPDKLVLMLDSADKLKTFLGADHDKRYLLVFQNNAEMRGSGGFLGSYALVDFRNGKIKNLEVPGGGSYDTEAGMMDYIKAPEPLRLVNPRWYFWDANWWPDWPTTAQNLMWFYEKSGGPSVDGVISFTPSTIESLLEITGPIDLQKDYGVTISSQNFWQEVQLITERDNIIKTDPTAVAHLLPGEKNKPKKIIGDLMAKMMEILPQKMDKNNMVKLISIAEKNLSSKQVMFYFVDPKLQEAMAKNHFDGAISATPLDYLMVVNTNIAGAKTDKVIKEEIFHDVSVASDGTMIDTVTIKREHTAYKNEPLVGVRNVNWLRVYVPLGSDLLAFSGVSTPDAKYFEQPAPSWVENDYIAAHEALATTDEKTGTKIYEENGKTVFANWVMLDPGQTSVVTLRYRLPFNLWQVEKQNDFKTRLNDWLGANAANFYSYSLLVQKQPGAVNESFKNNLLIPESYTSVWNSSTDNQQMEVLDKDKFFSDLITHKK